MSRQSIQKHSRGVSIRSIILPTALTVAVLHVMIINVIFMINRSSSNLSTIMQNAGMYTQEATSILAGSSLLSETSSNFILMPLTESGEVNVFPLKAYAQELENPRRGHQILEKFQTYDVDPAVLSCVEAAAQSAEALMEAQIHAITLMREVYPLPDVQPLTNIPAAGLSEREKEMTDEQKISAAHLLILGSEYGFHKDSVSRNINSAVGMLQESSGRMSAAASKQVAMLRQTLWIITLVIMVILLVAFLSVYTQIMKPLESFSRLILADGSLDETRGFREVRLVASSYNAVTRRRDALDSILKSAAETDSLTNLPNRYRFEQYILESEEGGYPAAVILFDVNYLKRTNDTQGHSAGDQLIRTAAKCISSCFGEHCFRIGGDEFAAIVLNCTPETIDQMISRFRETEKSQNVSVSLGYVYTEEISSTSFKRLLDEADRRMYDQKKVMHESRLELSGGRSF